MKYFLSLIVLILACAGTGFSQKTTDDKKPPAAENMTKIRERKPFEYDNESGADENGVVKRGDIIGEAKKVSLSDVLKTPEKFADKTVLVEGVVVRSCKMEGCWMELAPTAKDKSVRVTFKNNAFFIPLDSAGMRARAEGVFSVKTLSKQQVEHLVKEDGAKFDRINADGTATEISFEATGVELTKQTK
ncbi:MAG: DUF4920 domain-containing protein [Acidobacteriota bacterium]|nr:DUF4920 domain-containing protein [Acidobacteriota bacterium]